MKPRLVTFPETETETEVASPHVWNAHTVLQALRSIAVSFGLNPSAEAIRVVQQWENHLGQSRDLRDLGARIGLDVSPVKLQPHRIDGLHLPVMIIEPTGAVCIIDAISRAGVATFRHFQADQTHRNERPLGEILLPAAQAYLVRPLRNLADARIDDYIAPVAPNWLRKTLFPSVAPYGPVIIASFMTNTLALAGVIFTMQVYDRVIPAQSLPTLAVLFSGVFLAFFFEFFLKQARIVVLDVLGRDAGLRLSESVFGRALRVRSDHRPNATGSFIAQIRDIDAMREVMTSTSVGVVMDMPFFILFCAVFWLIAGPLVLIPIGALLVIILPGLMMQPKLRQAAQSAQREAALRNAVLVETIQGVDDIKAMQAEPRFESIWRQTSSTTAAAQSTERRLIGALTSWTQIVQQSVYVLVVAVGAPMVMAGDLTTGTLVGASILGSRMIAPMSQIAGVLSRLQQARLGGQGLEKIMRMPVDHPPAETRVTCDRLSGSYVLEEAVFKHHSSAVPALTITQLQIRSGERVGLVGRNGAGKSTLLQALSGQLLTASGQVRIDALSIDAIDPADVRRDVAYLSQNARLFYGTLRDNLLLGRPDATEAELLEALDLAGGHAFLSQFERGWDYQILEGGRGLSGGQKQSILLARLMLRRPSVMLLDEPTSAMDDMTERAFIESLRRASADRTLIIATHRQRILQLVDRLIVLDRGRIVLDGPRDDVLAKMRKGPA